MEHKLSSLSSQIVQPDTLLQTPNPNRLFIDVRLGNIPEDELKSFRECHIYGAVYAQIRDVFASLPTAESGNLPLPEIGSLREQLRRWQVDAETELVLYGPSMALAARGWWVLRWAGLVNVKVLDGGLKAWVNCGGAVAQGDFVPFVRSSPASLVLHPGNMRSISVTEVENLSADSILIDARDEASYLAGCIPGARNLAASEQWTPASSLRTVKEIRQLYDSVGVTEQSEVVVYCGGGVLSALEVLTLEALGVQSRLYVGSWSEWSKNADRMALSASKRVVA